MENSNNFCFINRINNLPSDLDPYIERVCQFTGMVILLGNSLVLRITNLFDLLKKKYAKNGMLGNKIKLIETIGHETLKMDESALNNFLVEIRKFNKYLNLAKHSLFAGDPEIIKNNKNDILLGDVTTLQIHKLLEKEQQNIFDLGSKINGDLDKIYRNIKENN